MGVVGSESEDRVTGEVEEDGEGTGESSEGLDGVWVSGEEGVNCA